MNNTSKDNSNEENNLSQILKESEEKTSIDFLLDLILRRKKFFLLTLIIFTSFSFIRTTREKIYNPVFKGEFSILIQDPIKQVSSNSFGTIGGVVSAQNFMGAANSNLEQDIPTLRELLLSDLVLQDLAKQYKLSTKSLTSRLDIKKDPKAKGILDFSLLSQNPKNDQSLLEDLSLLYVNYASLRTQKKLSDGLAFLSNQEPAIKVKNSQLLEKLEKFRRDKNFVDPLVEGENLKEYINRTKREITGLETLIERLKNIKKDISTGNVNSTSSL